MVDFTPGFNLRRPGGSAKSWGGSWSPIGPSGGGVPQSSAGGLFIEDKLSLAGGGGQVGNETAGQTLGASATATDPYAKYGGKESYDRLMSGFTTQKQNIYGTSKEAAENAGISRQSSILDFIQGLQTGQRGIDERGVQNELAKKQGTSSILDMVGRGIRSGGAMLANKNASDSSAAEGIARAYGDIGQRQLSGIGNQYELENRNIGIAQSDFDTQRQAGLRKFGEDKTTTVNGIVANARNSLAELDAAMVEADVPTRVAIEQEKNKIKQEALEILSRFDQQLSQGAQGVRASSADDRRRTAFGLSNAGTAAENPFDFSTEASAQFQGAGPSGSQLPLFLAPRRREA